MLQATALKYRVIVSRHPMIISQQPVGRAPGGLPTTRLCTLEPLCMRA